VHEAVDAGRLARREDVLCADHVAGLELFALAPVAERRGGVERELGALCAGAQRIDAAEVARYRFGAPLADLGDGGVGARQRAHAVPVADQPFDQPAADEPGAACYERRRHPLTSLLNTTSSVALASGKLRPAGLRGHPP
jgi:hypothetical protein